MLFKVKENISDFARFFESFIAALEKNKYSLANRRSVTFSTDLINIASTPDSQGNKYRYYTVVDEGRDEVSAKRSEFLIFADKQGNVVQKPSVAPAKSYEITTRSMARVGADFPRLIQTNYVLYVNAGEKTLQDVGRRSGSRRTPISVSDTVESSDGLPTASVTARNAVRVGNSRFNATKIVKTAVNNATRTTQTVAGAPSLKSQNFDKFEQTLRASNVGVIAGIFLGAAEASADTFRENTPTRKETGNFKLISAGGPPVILDPNTGGSLKKGYVLVGSGDIEEFIK